MKTILLAAAAFAGVAAPAAAQTGVLTIDLNRVFSESAAAKSGSSQIQTRYQASATGQQNAFNAAATGYNTQVEAARKLVKPDGSLPDAQRTTLAAAEQKLRAADEALQRTQQEANAVGNYVREQILRAALPIAEQIRAERKAAIVVPRNQVLAADTASDVTTTVIQRLDTQLKTVSIQLPQQPAQQPGTPAPQQPRPAQPQGR